MAVRLKRKLRGADGGKHPHVKNEQNFPPVVITPTYRRQRLREAAKVFLAHAAVWGCDRQAETIARAAVGALVDTLDKEGRG